ncbi:hypothetical protein EVAR_87681_1 [Eumeta japonica]|uniref:Uncharacterized protein n=1 Tax=Eumeta variegata TaxID=151549 RepID=A0A4C1XMH0_EUMVA|nr:hypothetical protein EVAR_87681_1 [Eumeta japonica]
MTVTEIENGTRNENERGIQSVTGIGMKTRPELKLISIDNKIKKKYFHAGAAAGINYADKSHLQESAEQHLPLCAAAVSLLLGRIGPWSGREIDASQAARLGRPCLSIACSALSLARSAQAERDNESCMEWRSSIYLVSKIRFAGFDFNTGHSDSALFKKVGT